MKVPDSGMPDEAYWNSLFDIPLIVDWLSLEDVSDPIVEIGCGFGTFTVGVAKRTSGLVHAFDIEPTMLEVANRNSRLAGTQNVRFYLRDIVEDGTALESNSVGLVLLFNILHSDQKGTLLEESCRILKSSGRVAIIHWRKDIETPRGPGCALRPDQETILHSIKGFDLHSTGNSRILKPYHWGIQLTKGMDA
jgi:ubiquinone/menaquinone biosynthesis C-methylase UbiE